MLKAGKKPWLEINNKNLLLTYYEYSPDFCLRLHCNVFAMLELDFPKYTHRDTIARHHRPPMRCGLKVNWTLIHVAVPELAPASTTILRF